MAKIKEAIEEFRPDSRLVDERGPTEQRKAKANGHSFKDAEGRTQLRDTPINTALSRKQITGAQYTAAQKFYTHWFKAGMLGNIASLELGGVFGRSIEPISETKMFHMQRFWQAVELVGKRRAWVLEEVICKEKSIPSIGFAMGWKNDRQAFAVGMTVTRESLDILCDEWGIHD